MRLCHRFVNTMKNSQILVRKEEIILPTVLKSKKVQIIMKTSKQRDQPWLFLQWNYCKVWLNGILMITLQKTSLIFQRDTNIVSVKA